MPVQQQGSAQRPAGRDLINQIVQPTGGASALAGESRPGRQITSQLGLGCRPPACSSARRRRRRREAQAAAATAPMARCLSRARCGRRGGALGAEVNDEPLSARAPGLRWPPRRAFRRRGTDRSSGSSRQVAALGAPRRHPKKGGPGPGGTLGWTGQFGAHQQQHVSLQEPESGPLAHSFPGACVLVLVAPCRRRRDIYGKTSSAPRGEGVCVCCVEVTRLAELSPRPQRRRNASRALQSSRCACCGLPRRTVGGGPRTGAPGQEQRARVRNERSSWPRRDAPGTLTTWVQTFASCHVPPTGNLRSAAPFKGTSSGLQPPGRRPDSLPKARRLVDRQAHGRSLYTRHTLGRCNLPCRPTRGCAAPRGQRKEKRVWSRWAEPAETRRQQRCRSRLPSRGRAGEERSGLANGFRGKEPGEQGEAPRRGPACCKGGRHKVPVPTENGTRRALLHSAPKQAAVLFCICSLGMEAVLRVSCSVAPCCMLRAAFSVLHSPCSVPRAPCLPTRCLAKRRRAHI